MSDEYIKMRNAILKNHNKIAELEQNVNKWKGLLVKADNEQSERIEKLEKQLVEPTVDNQTVRIYVYSDINPEEIKKEIEELKESLKRNIYVVLGDTSLKYTQLKEVLREIKQIVAGINYDISQIHTVKYTTYDHYSERLAEVEKKLSGENTGFSTALSTSPNSSQGRFSGLTDPDSKLDSDPFKVFKPFQPKEKPDSLEYTTKIENWGGTSTTTYEQKEKPEEPNDSKMIHITTCPRCRARVEIICNYYRNDPIEVEKKDLEYLQFIIENEGIHDEVTPEDYKKIHEIWKRYLSDETSKPESCQTCLYKNNMKDDNTCGMCNPNTPQSHWTPKKKSRG